MRVLPLFALLVVIGTRTVPLSGQAGGAAPYTYVQEPQRPGPSGFEENLGQVLTSARLPATDVRFRLMRGNTSIFLLANGIAYQFNHLLNTGETGPEPVGSTALETWRMDMVLEDANPHPRITTAGRSADHTHYYNRHGNGATPGVLDVHTYAEVTYHDVYPGIDQVFRAGPSGIEYDFVVHPYADPDRIRMRYTGHQELFVDGAGALIHGNRLGRFVEDPPVSLQKGHAVATVFALDDDLVRFDIDDHDPASELIIDPPRAWATYFGGPAFDVIQAIATDDAGNVYAAGVTRSDAGIASPGNDTVFNTFGDDDAFLAKFNTFGQRVWGIYYGWVQFDQFNAVAIDHEGDILCAGSTNSPTFFGIIANYDPLHQSSWAGGYDAMLIKFKPDGTRVWGTYYGGGGNDHGRGCAVDANNNIHLTGSTRSTNNIATSAAHQSSLSGVQDGFLARFNPAGQRIWGTYYGGSSSDVALDCATGPNGGLFIVGATGSTNGNTVAIAGHQNALNGSTDGFLAKFNSNGVRQWGTYYGGTSADTIVACDVDVQGNVYTAGVTYSSNGIAVLGAHQSARAGITDGFLVKFTTNGTRQWGTYYGGPSGDYGRDCVVDSEGRCLIAGESESSTGIASNGFQNEFGGAPSDAFLARFNPDGVRDLGTYYGAGCEDVGLGCAADQFGSLYLTGLTKCTYNIADSGDYAPPHQTYFGGGPEADGFLVKFGERTMDCLGIAAPEATIFPGVPCDDLDSCTLDDAWSLSCICTGTLIDADEDGVCDYSDLCPDGPDPGLACDDGDPETVIDFVDPSCTCVGIPLHCSTPEDCDDHQPCTANICTGDSCTYVPYVFGDIDGELSVYPGSTNTWTVEPVTDATAYQWQLPAGWTSADTTLPQVVATAGQEEGILSLCVTVAIGECLLDSCFDVLVSSVGIGEGGHLYPPSMTIRPNPSDGIVDLVLSASKGTTVSIHVEDGSGRVVRTITVPAGQRAVRTDLHDLSSGMYFVRLAGEGGARVTKLMIRR